ncbi:sensor histidine kinase [Clostridium sp. WILCCON 0269]|uniref:histidine kinase n=1 Tax=Candidatus Clostridium eludens TaxID=3381663 RepID=A0ABW8SUG6_9CLOT
MLIFIYILIFIIIFLSILLACFYKNINHICKYIDDIFNGNLNQRIRLQTHIKCFSKLTIKINNLIEKLQAIEKKNIISEESRKKIISNISHDLRTPLTSILGYMELILNDYDLSPDERKRYIKIAYTKGNCLYDMLEEFFQISKMDSKDFKLEIKSINICEIIRQQLVFFFNEFKRAGIEPKLNFPKDDVYVNADEKALNRILNNLISNALKHGKNSTKICINLSYTQNTVFISIWDNGLGIPKDEINYIFDRLYTIEKSRKSNSRSSGLGLSIVKKLLESLDGTISVSSVPFKKTEFKFTLPKDVRKL